MAFRIKTEAKNWFKDIRSKYEFDYYYLSLMAGLAERRKSEVPQSETTEIVQDFPGDYRTRGRIIIALFIRTELEEMGISLTERSVLNQNIGRLVDPHSPNRLSNEGEREMNKYANGGFEVLTEWFEDRPRTMEAFLPLYKRKIDAAIAASHTP